MLSKYLISEDINFASGYMSLELSKEVRDEGVHFRDFTT